MALYYSTSSLCSTFVSSFSPIISAILLASCWFAYTYGSSILSRCINHYLTFWFRVRSIDGSTTIPTCPYVWPNGQGDVAKFLDGEKNGITWGEKYGGIYRIWSGMTPEVAITDPMDIKIVFTDSDKHFKATNNNSGWLMGELLGKCVGLISGSDWQRVRAIAAAGFSHAKSVSYIPRIMDITKSHLEDLHKEESFDDKHLLHPVRDLKYLPFWILADILYGPLTPEMTRELEDLTHIRESLWGRMMQGGMTRFSWNRFLPSDTARKLLEFKQRWSRFNQAAREACTLSREETPVVEMYAAVDQGRMSMDECLQTLDEMLFANLDVTMGAISWNLLFLASNSDVQDQVRQEILSNTASGDEETTQYLLSTSTLLAASILESARLRPLAPFSVPQSVPTTRRVGGFVVPAGTNFIVDTYKLNVENPFWGPDKNVYRPARFMDGRLLNMRYHYWRFGFGPRQCIGKYVAELMIKVLLMHLLGNYRLGLDESTHWVKNPEMWISHPDTVVRCERTEK